MIEARNVTRKPASLALPPVSGLIALCALSASLSGCAIFEKPVVISADKLCQSWKHQTVKPSDVISDATAAKIEGNNKSRPEWGCEYGKDKAKG